MFKLSALILLALPTLTIAQAPNNVGKAFFDTLPKGTQFTTGDCKEDKDCQTGCCGQNNKCRNPEAFNSVKEFCQNGLTIDFPKRNSGGGLSFIQSPEAAEFFKQKGGQNVGNAGQNGAQNAGNNGQNKPPQNNGGGVKTVTVTKTIDCQATPPPANNNNNNQNNNNQNNQNNNNQNNQNNNNQNNGQCPQGSSKQVPGQCQDAKTSTSKLGGPQFALFDDRCKGTGFTTSKSTKDEECCTGCSDGQLCRAPDALKGVQTCRDGTFPDFSTGSVVFKKKAVSKPECGAKNFSKPECGGVQGGV
ncbi:hypothetical protein BC833DRAFT_609199 [Globomyces pollinis-pini]|nr:hypothetical protein BC833DRAFT_609199 [Globomyces pollinis-pini]